MSSVAYAGPLQRSLFCGVGPAVLDTVTVFFGVAFGGSMFVNVSSDFAGFSGVAISVFQLSRCSIQISNP